MKKVLFLLCFSAFAVLAQAQTYTFDCYCGFLSGSQCVTCNGGYTSAYFDGMIIKKDGKEYAYISKPFKFKQKGQTMRIYGSNGSVYNIKRTQTPYTYMTEFRAVLEACCSSGSGLPTGGTTGQFLISDGAGGGTWTTASATPPLTTGVVVGDGTVGDSLRLIDGTAENQVIMWDTTSMSWQLDTVREYTPFRLIETTNTKHDDQTTGGIYRNDYINLTDEDIATYTDLDNKGWFWGTDLTGNTRKPIFFADEYRLGSGGATSNNRAYQFGLNGNHVGGIYGQTLLNGVDGSFNNDPTGIEYVGSETGQSNANTNTTISTEFEQTFTPTETGNFSANLWTYRTGAQSDVDFYLINPATNDTLARVLNWDIGDAQHYKAIPFDTTNILTAGTQYKLRMVRNIGSLRVRTSGAVDVMAGGAFSDDGVLTTGDARFYVRIEAENSSTDAVTSMLLSYTADSTNSVGESPWSTAKGFHVTHDGRYVMNNVLNDGGQLDYRDIKNNTGLKVTSIGAQTLYNFEAVNAANQQLFFIRDNGDISAPEYGQGNKVDTMPAYLYGMKQNGTFVEVPTSAIEGADPVWFQEGTTTAPTAETQDIYRSSNVCVGCPTARLVTLPFEVFDETASYMRITSEGATADDVQVGIRFHNGTTDADLGEISFPQVGNTSMRFINYSATGNIELRANNNQGFEVEPDGDSRAHHFLKVDELLEDTLANYVLTRSTDSTLAIAVNAPTGRFVYHTVPVGAATTGDNSYACDGTEELIIVNGTNWTTSNLTMTLPRYQPTSTAANECTIGKEIKIKFMYLPSPLVGTVRVQADPATADASIFYESKDEATTTLQKRLDGYVTDGMCLTFKLTENQLTGRPEWTIID